jgi:hypothetical protein
MTGVCSPRIVARRWTFRLFQIRPRTATPSASRILRTPTRPCYRSRSASLQMRRPKVYPLAMWPFGSLTARAFQRRCRRRSTEISNPCASTNAVASNGGRALSAWFSGLNISRLPRVGKSPSPGRPRRPGVLQVCQLYHFGIVP